MLLVLSVACFTFWERVLDWLCGILGRLATRTFDRLGRSQGGGEGEAQNKWKHTESHDLLL
jgi:hypothetical protein